MVREYAVKPHSASRQGMGKAEKQEITTDGSASFIDALEGVRKVVDARKAEAS